LNAQGIAFNAVGRNAILSDENFNNGNYYDSCFPEKGLAVARMIGHITYLCEESMHKKFGRRLQNKNQLDFDFGIDFQVESYLQHQGLSFVERFDANSYLYITKAVDYFDLAKKFGSLEKAFISSDSQFLIISFSSDWLFPTAQSKEITKALVQAGKDVSFCEIKSPCGHDAFLLEFKTQTEIITSFLKRDF
jgi:homoserine O-acetyltransferase